MVDAVSGVTAIPIEALPRVVDDAPLIALQAPPPERLPVPPEALPYAPDEVAQLKARLAALEPPPPPAPVAPKTAAERVSDREVDKMILALPHDLESVICGKVGKLSWRDSLFAMPPPEDELLERECEIIGPELDRLLGDKRSKLRWLMYGKLHFRHISAALAAAEELRERREHQRHSLPPAPAPIAPRPAPRAAAPRPAPAPVPAAPRDAGPSLGGGGPPEQLADDAGGVIP